MTSVCNIDDYIQRAVALANDWNLLNDLRKNLRGMMKNSPLMNSTAYVRDVQETFKNLMLNRSDYRD